MYRNHSQKETGQSIVVLALLLVVFLAFVALALDGGNTYVRRRQAQTAADAGALAGARQLCETGSSALAITAAQEYAITRNGSDTANVSVDLDANQVEVDTFITFNTFLAHLLGRPQIEVQATATAECQAPGSLAPGTSVLPTAWACKPPISGISSSEDCQQQGIDMDTLDEYLNNPPMPYCDPICPELYIVMNSDGTGTDYCHDPVENPTGPIDCDFDNDGDLDLFPSGDRSWLNLDGGSVGAAEMIDWIENGADSEITVHMWFEGNPGVQNSVFSAVEDREGDILVVPVFDHLCDNIPSATGACSDNWDPDDDTVIAGSGTGSYFHITGFSLFYVACVRNTGGDSCPGHDVAVAAGMDNNEKTIEGYFIDGTVPGLGGGSGVEVGAYVIFLVK